jgi:hypothetical protein
VDGSIEEGVDSRGAGKVADRDALDIMGHEANGAVSVAQLKVGMVVCGVGNESHRVGKTHGAVKIREAEGFF